MSSSQDKKNTSYWQKEGAEELAVIAFKCKQLAYFLRRCDAEGDQGDYAWCDIYRGTAEAMRTVYDRDVCRGGGGGGGEKEKE